MNIKKVTFFDTRNQLCMMDNCTASIIMLLTVLMHIGESQLAKSNLVLMNLHKKECYNNV